MTVEYSNRAVRDLHQIAAESRAFGEPVAAALEARIRRIVAHIDQNPQAAPHVTGRPGIRVVPLVRYPYVIFYRVLPDRVRDSAHPAHLAPAVALTARRATS